MTTAGRMPSPYKPRQNAALNQLSGPRLPGWIRPAATRPSHPWRVVERPKAQIDLLASARLVTRN